MIEVFINIDIAPETIVDQIGCQEFSSENGDKVAAHLY